MVQRESTDVDCFLAAKDSFQGGVKMMAGLFVAIMENKISFSEAECIDVLRREGIDTDATYFRTLILCSAREICSIEQYQQVCTDLPRVCRNYWKKNGLHATVEVDYTGRIIVVLQERLDRDILEFTVQDFHKYLILHQHDQMLISVGKAVFQAIDIPKSYENALSALQNKHLYSDNMILFSEDLQSLLDATYLKSTINLDKILQAFRDDDIEQLRTLVTMYAEKVRSISGYYSERNHPTSIRRMFIELTVYVLHITSDLGINVDTLLNGLDPYTYIMNVEGGTPAIIDWFVGLCENLRRSVNEKKENKEDILIARACSYINEHLAQYDLSLSKVGEEISISSSYLSRLFRKKKEIGFAQYIVQERIELVKEKLRTTSISMDEIAQDAGFSSSSYMGRQLKKTTGMTPIAYRKKLTQM